MWFQIVEKDPIQPNGPPQTSLVEIGPRFVLTPIRIFEGAFSGTTVYSNPGQYAVSVTSYLLLIASRQSSYPPHQYALPSGGRRAQNMAIASRPRRSKYVGKSAESSRKTSLLYQKCSREVLYHSLPHTPCFNRASVRSFPLGGDHRE